MGRSHVPPRRGAGSPSEGQRPGCRRRAPPPLFSPLRRSAQRAKRRIGPLGRRGIEDGKMDDLWARPDDQGVALRLKIAWAFGPHVFRHGKDEARRRHGAFPRAVPEGQGTVVAATPRATSRKKFRGPKSQRPKEGRSTKDQRWHDAIPFGLRPLGISVALGVRLFGRLSPGLNAAPSFFPWPEKSLDEAVFVCHDDGRRMAESGELRTESGERKAES